MDEVLKRFFDKINFDGEHYFDGVLIEKVAVNKQKESWNVFLNCPNVIKIEKILELIEKCKNGIEEVKFIGITINNQNITNIDVISYFKFYLNLLIKNNPSLVSLLDSDIVFDNNTINIDVISKIESDLLKENNSKLNKWLKSLGFPSYKINPVINEEKQKKIKSEIESSKVDVVVKSEPTFKVIMGEAIKSKSITRIKDILGEENNVTIEAYVFGIDEFSSSKSSFKILTLKVSDKSDSILAKIFSREEEEYKAYKNAIKVGSWYRFRGYTKNDQYAKDIVLNLRDVEEIPSKDVCRVDDELVKRVELHTHTMMSQMDGVVDAKTLLKSATKWGHKAMAFTDHNGAQSFPEVYHFVTDYNKGKEDCDKFKAIYGTELLLIDDTINIVNREIDASLDDSIYCVFDLETTGFNAGGGDSIIEIGAVLLQNGEIIDSFNELINPGRKLPPKITEVTSITDEMLEGKDNEENAIKRFIAWFKDYPMVAHNAKFDASFIEMAYSKYDLGEFKNTIIDTMEISKALEPEQARHSLSALVKRYDIPFDEEGHHRADYDAEGTAKILAKMIKRISASGIKNIKDLNSLVKQEDIYKFGRSYHVNILAKNKVGLKNLFKIISLANTKYLYKVPRILRSTLNELREGLLIGSGCYQSEVFTLARSKTDEELINIINFYDYVEVQPPNNYVHLLASHDFDSEVELLNTIRKVINLTKEAGKIIVATSDAHHLNDEDKIYRDIIMNQKVPGGGRHPLAKYGKDTPSQYLRTTSEMLDEFKFLNDEDLIKEIVIDNTLKIADMIEIIEVIIETGGVPFSPKIDNSVETVKELVYGKAHSIYGDPLPELIETRISQELTGIIKGGFDVIYLIAQKLVKHSNDEGYLVGSRGSVGSSFVATMMGITEVNPLPAHYVCPKCKHTIFELNNRRLSLDYSSGFDLPDYKCPKCGDNMDKSGQDMPFATFLGFDADKVPDIDLNFSGDNQASAHNYTKVLFGEDNVYRAGTIGTVAEKTAYGFVKGYCEDKGIMMRSAEIERLALGCTGVKRTTGQHPGGIVVIPGYMDVYDFTPYQYPADDPDKSWRTTHFDYHAIDQDVLKLDILGHDDPTVLRKLQDLSGIDVTKIPMDDKDTMSIFCSPNVLGVTSQQINCTTGTLGIPEFGTKFVIKMLEDTKPTTFSELIKISGLSHGTDVWVGNAQELIINNVVPFKEVIGCRDDIMVYLMNNGLEPKKAFKIMEFVRKGKPSKDPEGWKTFEKEMIDAGIADWYIKSCQKIKYMFPKAHAAAYVISAFRIAYFKVHYPIYYYSAYFSIRCDAFEVPTLIKNEKGIRDRISELEAKGYDLTNKESAVLDVLYVALEMCARGFTFKNIDLKISGAKEFVISEDKKSLYIPFNALDGLGENVANQIIEERKKAPFFSIEDFQNRGRVSQTIVDNMRLLEIFGSMPESSQLSLF